MSFQLCGVDSDRWSCPERAQRVERENPNSGNVQYLFLRFRSGQVACHEFIEWQNLSLGFSLIWSRFLARIKKTLEDFQGSIVLRQNDCYDANQIVPPMTAIKARVSRVISICRHNGTVLEVSPGRSGRNVWFGQAASPAMEFMWTIWFCGNPHFSHTRVITFSFMVFLGVFVFVNDLLKLKVTIKYTGVKLFNFFTRHRISKPKNS